MNDAVEMSVYWFISDCGTVACTSHVQDWVILWVLG